MAAEIPVKVTGDSKDAVNALSEVDKALLALVESEKRMAAINAAKAKFDAMTEAEKQAFAESVKLGNALETTGDQASESGEAFRVAGLSVTDLNSALEIAGKAVEVLKQVYEETVGAVLAYSDQVRDLGRISGATAEETSRLIQTSDDLQVSYETLQAAAKALAKDGIALTTEELAKASDEYLAIEGAGARAEFATTKFGRAGLELTKILETGGAALREMAAATDENLVMTEAQVKAARDLEIQMDNLEDSVAGVKLAIGNALVPAIVDAISKMMRFSEETKKMFSINEDIAKIVQKHSIDVAKTTKTYEEYAKEMIRVDSVRKGGSTSIEVQSERYRRLSADLSHNIQIMGGLTRAEWEAIQGGDVLTESLRNQSKATVTAESDIRDLALALMAEEGAYTDTGSAARAYTSAVVEQAGRLDNLKVAMNIKTQADAFAASQSDMQGRINGTKQLIDDLSKMQYRTPEQEAQLEDLRQQLRDQELALQDLERTHKKATDSMIFNMVLQKAASDGLTAVELSNLLKIGNAMGLVDEKTYLMGEELNKLDISKPISDMKEFDGVLARILGRPASKTFTFTTRYTKIGDDPGEPTSPIPGTPGWGNGGGNNGVVGAQGEERMTPADRMPNARMVSGNITNNFYISGWAGDGASLAAEVMRQQQLAELKR